MTTEIPEPTRTEETEHSYAYRAKLFIRDYLKQHSECHVRSIPSEGFGYWMIEMKPTLAPSTWRQYRSSVLSYAECSRMLDYDVLKEILYSEKEKSTSCSDTRANKRAKSVKIEDLLAIKDYLLLPGRREPESHAATYNFFMASLVVGFRPCEWKGCTIEFHLLDTSVEVVNAKHTNGRGFGEKREIHVDNSCAEEIVFIKETIKFIDGIRKKCSSDKEFKKEYAKRIAAMQKQFRVMNKALFPERKRKIHLYSARHQAAANFKSMGYTRSQVAALMGHRSVNTASEHYGLGANGRGGNSPNVKPDPANVAQVEALNIGREPSSYVSKAEKAQRAQAASNVAKGGVATAAPEAASPTPNDGRQEAKPILVPKNLALLDQSNIPKPSSGLTLG